jgi:hypothetical protein
MSIDYMPDNMPDYTPDNTFIFCFVRMNPPTPGHLELIKTMIYKGIELGAEKAYVITSSSMDGKNPLPCSDITIPKAKNKNDSSIVDSMIQTDLIYKSTVLNEMIYSYKQQLIELEPDTGKKLQIENFQVIVLCSAGSPFAFIFNVIKNDYIDKGVPKVNMFFIVGRDRADFFDTVVVTFRSKDYIHSVNGIVLEREGMEALKNTGMGERSIDDINPSEYSASFVRGLVKNGQLEDFNKVYSPFMRGKDIQKLYETIQLGIQMKSPSSKEEVTNPRSIYYDDKDENGRSFLPIINHNGGKKIKRTRKTRKSRRTRRIAKRKTSRRKY